ncbi:MAG: amidohydrolase family protein [Bacteroidales bacterium]
MALRIDAHMHLGLNGDTAGSVLRRMDDRRMDACILLTWEEVDPAVPQRHMDLPPEPLLEAAAEHPGRFVPFYAPDPGRPDPVETLRTFSLRGIRGCGELKVGRLWSDALIRPYLEEVNRLGQALVIHMEDPGWHYVQEKEGRPEYVFERLMNTKYNGLGRHRMEQLARHTGLFRNKIRNNRVPFPGILYDFEGLESRLREYPDLRVVGHGPGFWNHIARDQDPRRIHQKGPIREFGIIDRLLEECPNLYCDLSGTSGFNAMKRDPERSRIFLQKHSDKVMFGTDNTAYPLEELLHDLRLGTACLNKILGGTAEKVLLG